MSINFNTAAKCFKENLQLFTNPQTNPEQFNLYSGLLSLAQGMAQLESEVQALQQEIRNVKARFG